MCVSVTMSGEITSQPLAAAASAQASSSTSSGDPGATNGQVMLHSFHVVVTLHAQRITDQCTSTVRSFAARPAAAAVKKNRRRDSSSVHGARCESPWARGFLSLSCVPLSHHPRGGGRRQHTVTLAGRVCHVCTAVSALSMLTIALSRPRPSAALLVVNNGGRFLASSTVRQQLPPQRQLGRMATSISGRASFPRMQSATDAPPSRVSAPRLVGPDGGLGCRVSTPRPHP
jgi:hypothetical protein